MYLSSGSNGMCMATGYVRRIAQARVNVKAQFEVGAWVGDSDIVSDGWENAPEITKMAVRRLSEGSEEVVPKAVV